MIPNDELLLKVYRLANIVRYSTRVKIKRETVAEHSFYVALFVLNICDNLNINNDTKLLCLIKALLHDMPETELNDITHDVKVKLNLRSILSKYEDEYFDREFPKYADLMKLNTEPIDAIVEFADVLSVRQYVLNEMRLGNNSQDMHDILIDAEKRITDCHAKVMKLWRNDNE